MTHWITKTGWIVLGIALILSISLASAQDREGPSAIAIFVNQAGDEIGQANFIDSEGKVTVQIQIDNLEPGFHGIHLHAIGTCNPEGASPFGSAGEHWTLADEQHPTHTGDLSTILINRDGSGLLILETDRFSVDQMFDTDGTAVIVHAIPDNFANIPERYGGPDDETVSAGDSELRVACGVITTPDDVMDDTND